MRQTINASAESFSFTSRSKLWLLILFAYDQIVHPISRKAEGKPQSVGAT
jgi:hypothetical protein